MLVTTHQQINTAQHRLHSAAQARVCGSGSGSPADGILDFRVLLLRVDAVDAQLPILQERSDQWQWPGLPDCLTAWREQAGTIFVSEVVRVNRFSSAHSSLATIHRCSASRALVEALACLPCMKNAVALSNRPCVNCSRFRLLLGLV